MSRLAPTPNPSLLDKIESEHGFLSRIFDRDTARSYNHPPLPEPRNDTLAICFKSIPELSAQYFNTAKPDHISNTPEDEEVGCILPDYKKNHDLYYTDVFQHPSNTKLFKSFILLTGLQIRSHLFRYDRSTSSWKMQDWLASTLKKWLGEHWIDVLLQKDFFTSLVSIYNKLIYAYFSSKAMPTINNTVGDTSSDSNIQAFLMRNEWNMRLTSYLCCYLSFDSLKKWGEPLQSGILLMEAVSTALTEGLEQLKQADSRLQTLQVPPLTGDDDNFYKQITAIEPSPLAGPYRHLVYIKRSIGSRLNDPLKRFTMKPDDYKDEIEEIRLAFLVHTSRFATTGTALKKFRTSFVSRVRIDDRMTGPKVERSERKKKNKALLGFWGTFHLETSTFRATLENQQKRQQKAFTK